jgi:hypothetical protein
MLEDEKMDTDIVIDFIKSFNLIFSHDFLFGDFIAPLYLLDKPEIVILDVTFFKNDWSNLVL